MLRENDGPKQLLPKDNAIALGSTDHFVPLEWPFVVELPSPQEFGDASRRAVKGRWRGIAQDHEAAMLDQPKMFVNYGARRPLVEVLN